MVVVGRRRFGLRIREVYFADFPVVPETKTDIVLFIGAKSPALNLPKARTLLIDLGRNEDHILGRFSRNTRYEVNRSAKDDLQTTWLASPRSEDVRAFCDFYETFARERKLPLTHRPRTTSLSEVNALSLSLVRDHEGTTLCYHAYVADREIGRARQLYSVSRFRAEPRRSRRRLIGRANRRLHWVDIVELKADGFAVYDVGGIPPPDAGKELRQIGEFKRGFGGVEVVEYGGLLGVTRLGRLACSLRTGGTTISDHDAKSAR